MTQYRVIGPEHYGSQEYYTIYRIDPTTKYRSIISMIPKEEFKEDEIKSIILLKEAEIAVYMAIRAFEKSIFIDKIIEL